MYYHHEARLATSDDLIEWKPTGQRLWGYRQGHFDSASGEPGTAMLTDQGIVFIYVGQNHSGGAEQGADPTIAAGTWSLGQAQLDAKDPARLLARLEKPFLLPEYDWETKGFTPHATVMHDGLVSFKGQWLLYYGAADRHIGLAVCGRPRDAQPAGANLSGKK